MRKCSVIAGDCVHFCPEPASWTWDWLVLPQGIPFLLCRLGSFRAPCLPQSRLQPHGAGIFRVHLASVSWSLSPVIRMGLYLTGSFGGK